MLEVVETEDVLVFPVERAAWQENTVDLSHPILQVCLEGYTHTRE